MERGAKDNSDLQAKHSNSSAHKLAAIMFTDIVGYTALMNDDEDKAYAILEKNRQIHKNLIKKFNGHWIKEIGDGVLISFTSISEALNCAKEIMAAVSEYPDLELRMGIHQGEVLFRDGDIFGNEVNIASRIQALAPPGRIWISGQVYRNISNHRDIKTRLIGDKELRNVKESIRVYEVELEDGLQNLYRGRKLFNKNLILAAMMILIISISGYLFFKSQISNTYENYTPSEGRLDKSIAILPFKNLSAEKGNQHFADGIMDGIHHHLSTIQDLRVVSRSSTEGYREFVPPVPEIAEKLNVSYLLEASVFKSADRIRITLQLIDARSDEQIWNEQFDREIRDVFEVMSDISKQVAIEIEAIISPSVQKRMETIPTDNLEAYNQYLLGRHFWFLEGEHNLDKSLEYYRKALEIDSDFALAYVGIAVTYSSYGWFLYKPNNEVIPMAVENAHLALAMDSTLGQAYVELAFAEMIMNWDWSASESYYKKALALNPNDARTHNMYGWLLSFIGRTEEAINESTLAHNLEPLSVAYWTNIARHYYLSRDYDRAIKEYRKVIIVFPDKNYSTISWYPRTFLAQSLSTTGFYDEAVSEFNKADYDSSWPVYLGYTYAKMNKSDETKEIIDFYIELSRSYDVWNSSIAILYGSLGEKDLAFEWLNKAITHREGWLPFLKMDPIFDNLRSEPRFQELLEKMNFPD